MSRQPDRIPSQRQLRVGEEVRHALAQAFERGEVRDPALVGRSMTVTEVRISPDLKNATAFVMPLGGGEAEEAVAALNRASSFLRGWVGKQVRLRHVPKLNFRFDDSFDEAAHLDSLLHDPRVLRDVEQGHEEEEE
jgi:ribosome-binding factor A